MVETKSSSFTWSCDWGTFRGRCDQIKKQSPWTAREQAMKGLDADKSLPDVERHQLIAWCASALANGRVTAGCGRRQRVRERSEKQRDKTSVFNIKSEKAE